MIPFNAALVEEYWERLLGLRLGAAAGGGPGAALGAAIYSLWTVAHRPRGAELFEQRLNMEFDGVRRDAEAAGRRLV